jgi:hypothetical protein
MIDRRTNKTVQSKRQTVGPQVASKRKREDETTDGRGVEALRE